MSFASPEDEIAWEFAEERGGKPQANLSVDEVKQLIQAARDKSDRDGLILQTLYATATRVSELVSLFFSDLVYGECRVFVREGKGGKDRYTLLDSRTAEQLKAWQGDRPIDSLVFEIGERQVNRIVKEAGETTGLLAKYEALGQTLSPHSFRHAYATHCYESGIDLFTLKQLLGHSYLETTLLYVTISAERQESSYGSAHELARKTSVVHGERQHMSSEQENNDPVYQLVRQAILDKKQVHGDYNGHHREMCPYVLGHSEGHAKCLFFQFGGSSSSEDPLDEDFRCMTLAKLSNVKAVEGPWHGPDEHRQTCVRDIDVVVKGFKLLG